MKALLSAIKNARGELTTVRGTGMCHISHEDLRALLMAGDEMMASRVDGMLPQALEPVADQWYRLCERRHAVDRITISGTLARAIVDAVCQVRAAGGE